MGSKVQEPEVVTRFVLLLFVLKIHLLSKYVIVCRPSIVINDHTFNTVSSQIIPLVWCDVISVHFAEGIYNMGTQVWINVCWFKFIWCLSVLCPVSMVTSSHKLTISYKIIYNITYYWENSLLEMYLST